MKNLLLFTTLILFSTNVKSQTLSERPNDIKRVWMKIDSSQKLSDQDLSYKKWHIVEKYRSNYSGGTASLEGELIPVDKDSFFYFDTDSTLIVQTNTQSKYSWTIDSKEKKLLIKNILDSNNTHTYYVFYNDQNMKLFEFFGDCGRYPKGYDFCQVVVTKLKIKEE